jgi:hypothetical protein
MLPFQAGSSQLQEFNLPQIQASLYSRCAAADHVLVQEFESVLKLSIMVLWRKHC